MRTRLLIAAIPVLNVFSSCQREDKPPIPREQMAQILIDIHLAEAYAGILTKDSVHAAVKVKNIDSLAVYYKEILQKHQVKADSFDSAFKWYRYHPALMDSLYERVVAHFDSLQMIK
ncbi:MAG: DUF4296 domain-containing protein [Chitinophagaceae bacterium]